jgi:hypothetical protein
MRAQQCGAFCYLKASGRGGRQASSSIVGIIGIVVREQLLQFPASLAIKYNHDRTLADAETIGAGYRQGTRILIPARAIGSPQRSRHPSRSGVHLVARRSSSSASFAFQQEHKPISVPDFDVLI